MSDDALVVDGLAFAYAAGTDPVFSGISARFEPGTRVGVWGPNGSGKTTLLRILAGDLLPTAGTVVLGGSPIDAMRRSIGIVAADFDMFEYLSLEDNVRFFLEFYGVAVDPAAVEEFFARYELSEHRRTEASAASRGMRRKTQIVTALLCRPRLLIADEPLDGLDVNSQSQWLTDVDRAARDGAIVVTALHSLERLRASSDSVISMTRPVSVEML